MGNYIFMSLSFYLVAWKHCCSIEIWGEIKIFYDLHHIWLQKFFRKFFLRCWFSTRLLEVLSKSSLLSCSFNMINMKSYWTITTYILYGKIVSFSSSCTRRINGVGKFPPNNNFDIKVYFNFISKHWLSIKPNVKLNINYSLIIIINFNYFLIMFEFIYSKPHLRGHKWVHCLSLFLFVLGKPSLSHSKFCLFLCRPLV